MKISLTQDAKRQLDLYYKEELAPKNKYFRIAVSGKGCDGFEFVLGIDFQKSGDTLVLAEENIPFLADFLVFNYAKNLFLDYLFDPLSQEEGFIIQEKEENYKGKFWKKRPDLVVPLEV